MLKTILKKRNLAVITCAFSALATGSAFATQPAQQVSAQALPAQQVVAAVAAVNVNTATAVELAAALKGVGLAKAEAIVAFRDLNGPFLQLEEMTQVKGIGSATVEKNEAVIRFQ